MMSTLTTNTTNTVTNTNIVVKSKIDEIEHILAKCQELRLEIGDAPIRIKLLTGTAEIFGTELVCDTREYTFRNCSVGVFSWHGATVLVSGTPVSVYVAEETPMTLYVNTHSGLYKLRKEAEKKNARGPVALIVGPVNVGKTTLSRSLVNWAVSSGHHPVFVDLDVGQNTITVPGAIAATPIEYGIPPEDQNGITLQTPLTYFYGHTSPGKHLDIYKQTVETLKERVWRRLEKHDKSSGVIVNTCGWVDGEGYNLILHAVATFEVDVLLVLGQEKLYSQLRNEQGLNAAVVKLTKSGGVIDRDSNKRRMYRNRRFRSYFYGPQGNLAPMEKVVEYMKDIVIYEIGLTFCAPSHALPLGQESKLDKNQWRKMAFPKKRDLVNRVLAVSYAADESTMKTSNVAGFVHVLDVDESAQRLKLLVPVAGPLPGKILLTGSDSSVSWTD